MTAGSATPGARAVVVLARRLGAVLPAAAIPLLRTGAPVYADADLPADLADQFTASVAAAQVDAGLLLTLDPATGAAARWVAAGAPVLRTPEPDGAALLDAVAVMDRLRSPGGCPWDAEQTHRSLMPYLIEETYELYEALEDEDAAAMREELGDVLLQVLFHARVACEAPGTQGFDIDAVAGDLVTKLVSRHPHVFAASEQVRTATDQEHRWEQLKRAEKGRESSVDGVALAQPAAALAAKLVSRTARAGLPADLLPRADADDQGERLFAVAAAATLDGADPEDLLRTAARRFAARVRLAELSARDSGTTPHHLTPTQWRHHWPT